MDDIRKKVRGSYIFFKKKVRRLRYKTKKNESIFAFLVHFNITFLLLFVKVGNDRVMSPVHSCRRALREPSRMSPKTINKCRHFYRLPRCTELSLHSSYRQVENFRGGTRQKLKRKCSYDTSLEEQFFSLIVTALFLGIVVALFYGSHTPLYSSSASRIDSPNQL